MLDPDLEQRAHFYWSQIHSPDQLRARQINKNIAKKATEAQGDEILLLPHIVAVAYFLGYGEKNSLSLRDFYTRNCRDGIVKLFSDEDKIDCKKYGQKTYQGLGVRRKDVERLFEEMSQKAQLNYSPQRFTEALKLL